MAQLKLVHRGATAGPVIVFVHGLGGDPFTTWTGPGVSSDNCWMHWVGQDTNCDTWTLKYDATPSRWQRQAMPLPDQGNQVARLLADHAELKDRPIVLVGHSLGGLVLKTVITQTLASGDERTREMVRRIRGVVFVATPHQGSQLANLASVLATVLRTNLQVRDMHLHDAHLRQLGNAFREQRRGLHMSVASFAEGRDVVWEERGWLGSAARQVGVRVVDPSSSDPALDGVTTVSLNEDHLSICKPANRDAQIHRALVAFMKYDVLSLLTEETKQPNDAVHPSVTCSAWEWPLPRDFSALVHAHSAGFTGRQWLTNRVLEWLRTEAPGTCQALLVEAPFGVGKSAFMARLAGRLHDDGFMTAVHFCRFDDQDDLQPGKIVRSLAAQLRALLKDYGQAVEASPDARRALDGAEAAPGLAWSRAVVDPLAAVRRAPGELPLVLLIDGLDESLELHSATTSPEGSLLDMIIKGTAARLPHWVRIVASSRPVQQLGAQTERFQVEHMLHDEGAANREDLEEFVRGRTAQPLFQALLAAAGLAPDQFVNALIDLCDGKFLLARYVTAEAASRSFGPSELNRVLRRGREIPGTDAWFELVFARRLRHVQVVRAKARAVLGIVAVALTPLPETAIAAVLHEDGVKEADVHALVSTFGGLLRHDARGGVTFDHFCIEQWLDPSLREGLNAAGMPKAGDFAIDRQVAHQRLQQHCARGAVLPLPALQAGGFDRYLEKNGVLHLIDAGLLPQALALLERLPLEAPRVAVRGPRPPAPPPPRRLETRVIDAIDDALRDYDRRPPDDASAAEAAKIQAAKAQTATLLAALDASALHHLLRHRDYETGKYQPMLRVLIQFRPEAWPAIRARCRHDLRDDIVFRVDLGVAYAEAWWSSDGDDRARVLQAIEQMAQSDSPDEREIAGYALKHICQKIDPRPWWADIEPTIRRLAARYATSSNSSDRMVAGEMLLALAIQGVPVRNWFAGLPGEQRFWEPCWPNLRMDIEATCVHVDQPMAWSGRPPADAAKSWAAAKAQHQRALALASQLGAHSLLAEATPQPKLWRLRWSVGLLQDQQCDTAGLDESLDDLLTLLADPPRGFDELLLNIVVRLMLHPAWDITETGASLVADLIKRQDRARRPWWLIDRLLQADPTHWRLLYGALDAAFNAGPLDGYVKFRQALLAMGRLPQCRVRGICADDLRMWLKRASPPERRKWLTDPEVRKLLKCWLKTADDIWLLEYLHLIFSEMAQPASGVADLVPGLMPAKLSRYLCTDATRSFHVMDADEFLAAVEALRSAEWNAATS
ncbi:MAG: AAA family ATPase [Pseudomonadota bacterium]